MQEAVNHVCIFKWQHEGRSIVGICQANHPQLTDLLADANMTGTLPASLGSQLPDLQLLSLRHNPGITQHSSMCLACTS